MTPPNAAPTHPLTYSTSREVREAPNGMLVLRISAPWGHFFSVYEESPRRALASGQIHTYHSHSTLHAFNDHAFLGKVGTRILPANIDALPVGPERSAAVDAFHHQQYEMAYGAIIATFPEAAAGRRESGEVAVYNATRGEGQGQ